MSRALHLECRSHEPPLRADQESGYHPTDIDLIRLQVANREALVSIWEVDQDLLAPGATKATVRFLAQHPQCTIAVVDEGGDEHPLTVEALL